MSIIFIKTETCHLHQSTEKTFLICHKHIVPCPLLFAVNLWNMFNRTEMIYHAPTIAQRAGIGVSKAMYLHVIYVLENSICPLRRRKHDSYLAQRCLPRQHYLDSSGRILRILNDYPNRQRLQYLRATAHSLSF